MMKIVLVLWLVVGDDRRSSIVERQRSGEEWSMGWGLEHDRRDTPGDAICRG
jgi:hypothetical protein